MAKTTKSNPTFSNIPSMFDAKAFQDAMSDAAQRNARMTSIFLDAAARSTEIVTAGTHETLSNIRDLTAMRDEPGEYAEAYSDFMRRQADLARRSAEELASVTQRAGTETSEIVTDGAEAVFANANKAAQKTTSATKKAA